MKLFEKLVNEKRSGIAHLKLFPTSFSLISCFKLTKRMFINYLMMRSTFYGGSELSTNCNTTRAHLDLDPKTKRFLVGWTEIYFIRDYYLHRNLSLKSTFDRCYDLYELSTYLQCNHFYKKGHPRPLFLLFLVFSNKQYKLYYELVWKNVHLVSGARIRTHNLPIMSLLF